MVAFIVWLFVALAVFGAAKVVLFVVGSSAGWAYGVADKKAKALPAVAQFSIGLIFAASVFTAVSIHIS